MIKLCTGSLFKAFSLCRAEDTCSDQELAEILFYPADQEGFIAHVKDCKNNVPRNVYRNFAQDSDHDVVFREAIKNVEGAMDLLPSDNISMLVAGLVDIISRDDSIPEEAVLGYDERYQKRLIRVAKKYYPLGFLANVLIHTVKTKDNPKGKAGIKELDLTYLVNIEASQRDMEIVNSEEDLETIEELEKASAEFESNGVVTDRDESDSINSEEAPISGQYNFDSVVINSTGTFNYYAHVDEMHFD